MFPLLNFLFLIGSFLFSVCVHQSQFLYVHAQQNCVCGMTDDGVMGDRGGEEITDHVRIRTNSYKNAGGVIGVAAASRGPWERSGNARVRPRTSPLYFGYLGGVDK